MSRLALAFAILSCGGPGPGGRGRLAAPGTLQDRLDAALRRDAGDLRSGFVRAVLLGERGRSAEAVDAWSTLFEAASGSRDEIAADVAEVAVHALEDLEERAPGWRAKVEALAARRLDSPGAIGPFARHTLAEIHARLALRGGDPEEAGRRAAAAGCAPQFRVAGPFGPRDLLEFDLVRAPEGTGALSSTYDLGPGRGVRRTRTEHSTACAANVGGDLYRGGTTVATSWVEVPRETEAILIVESPNSFRVTVNGVRLLVVDARIAPHARVHAIPVRLPSGASKVSVAIGTRHPNPVLVVSLIDRTGRPAGTWLQAEPATTGAWAELASGPESNSRTAPSEDRSEAESLLRAMRSLGRGDVSGARRSLFGAPSPLAAAVRAGALLADASLPDEIRRERARRELERAVRADPALWQARVALAQLLSAEDRIDDAVGALEEAERRAPAESQTPLLLADLFTSRGWDAQADAAIARARAANPDACGPIAAAYGAARRRGDGAAADEIARAHLACDARSDGVLDGLRISRRWDDAVREAERILSLDPQSPSAWREVGTIRLARGDLEGADRAFLRALAIEPLDSDLLVQRMDLALARGDAPSAIGILDAPLALFPAEGVALHRPRAFLEGRSLFGAFRLDGRTVIRDFEASGRTWDAPSVLVLDYTVVRVLPDGSSLELTHNVVRVQSDEGVEQWGEWSAPEGADVLAVRTVKADGTRLEPEEIAGKATLSLPNLAVGDYVEYEYIAAHPASGAAPGGFYGDRFYFQSFEVPFDRTELTLVVPAGLDLVVSARGEAPTPREDDWAGLRVIRFRRDAVPARVAEPRSVSTREFIASVQLSRGATWDSLADGLRDSLVDRVRRDPEVDALVRRITAGAHRRSARARRIWRWVLDNVDDQADPFGQASHAILAKTGSRVRALHAMLRVAGIDADLALARDVAADATRSDVADADTYEHFLVRAETEEGVQWLAPWDRHLPWGYLPAAVRGQKALVLGADRRGEHLFERIPDDPEGSERHRIRARATLAANGGGVVAVKETLYGAGGVRWRAALSEMPAHERDGRFEREYVARLVEGAVVRSLEVQGLDDPDGPLVLEYEFEAPRLARATGGGLELRPLFPMVVGPDYAPLPARTVTLALLEQVDTEVEITVVLPPGSRPGIAPSVRERAPLARFEGDSRHTDGQLVLRRRLRVSPGRVTPREYGTFAAFCRAVDRFETSEIRIEGARR